MTEDEVVEIPTEDAVENARLDALAVQMSIFVRDWKCRDIARVCAAIATCAIIKDGDSDNERLANFSLVIKLMLEILEKNISKSEEKTTLQ